MKEMVLNLLLTALLLGLFEMCYSTPLLAANYTSKGKDFDFSVAKIGIASTKFFTWQPYDMME